MKKLIFLLALIAFACADNQVQIPEYNVQKLVGGYSTSALDYTSTASYNDWSNTVHTIVVETIWSPKQQNYGAAALPADYVLIGGGAYTNNTTPGAYLIGSYPDFTYDSWWAFSKDHAVANSHTLRVFAVGLKIDGVTKSALKSAMTFVTAQSPTPVAHPTSQVTVGAGYNLIGGGANTSYNTTWPGNLLTASYPSGNTWYVASKDHIYSCPALIISYAIGIPSTVAGFNGQLEVQWQRNSPVVYGSGIKDAQYALSLQPGWAPACSGGQATYSAGRLLTGLRPPFAGNGSFYMTSKDCNVGDSGYTYLYASMIRKKP